MSASEGDSVGRSPATVRVRAYRARMKEKGLRPIQLWVPDVRDPDFTSNAHLQSVAVATSPQAVDDQEFIDAISASSE